jgi:hypothetical protein
MSQQSPTNPSRARTPDQAQTEAKAQEQQQGAQGTTVDRDRDPELKNEGEGSRSGARRYDAGAERAASDPERVDELADEAKTALEGPEGDALREADERGKKSRHN